MNAFSEAILYVLRVCFEIVTIVVTGGCLFTSLKRIYYGKRSICNFMYLMGYVFFVFPIIINLFLPYEYKGFVQANAAMKDDSSLIIYYIFVMVLSLALVTAGKKSKVVSQNALQVNPYIIWIGSAVIVISLLLTLIQNGFGILSYGFGGAYFSDEYTIFTPLFSMSTIFFLILTAYHKNVGRALYAVNALCMFLLLFIQGKRSLIAEFLIMLIFVLAITRPNINPKRIMKLLIVAGVAIVGFSVFYGIVLKGNASSVFDFLCIDLSRQYTLVYQFYCDKIGRPISVNHFDAVVYILFFWVPRSAWPDKPYPFSNSLTRSMVGFIHPQNENMGWSTTCAIFSDLFDSFWYFGLVIGIYIVVKLCKKTDASSRTTVKVFLIYLIVHLLTVQLSAALIALAISWILIALADYLYVHSKGYRIKQESQLLK